MTEVLNTVAQGSVERMLDSLVQGSALALAAWLLLRSLPSQRAATRFAVWVSALAGIAALPFLNGSPAGPHRIFLSSSLLKLPPSSARILFLTWVVFALLAFVRLIVGLIELTRIRRNCRPVVGLSSDIREILERSRTRNVEILSSDTLKVPTALGFTRPAVIIPKRLLRELSPSELKQVMLHELAHLNRWDDWTNLALQLLKVVFCFHPAVWWIDRRIALEREMACDDAVLAGTSDRQAYAKCLTRLAERSFASRSVALVQAAVSRMRQTTLRVSRILEIDSTSPVAPHKTALAATASLVFAATAFVAHPAQLISFGGDRPSAVAHTADAAYSAESLPRQIAPTSLRSTNTDLAPRAEFANLSDRSTARSEPTKIRPALARHNSRTQERVLRVVRTKFSLDAGHSANTQPAGVLLVYYSETWDSHSTPAWRVAIWQFTPAPSSQVQAHNEFSRKSI